MSLRGIMIAAGLVQVAMIGSSGAAVLASTNFDSRALSTGVAANDTATGLNWTTNGLEDPGSMSALQSNGTTGQALFNNTTLTQNNFTPALNVGNGNTYWTTTISITVAAGSAVTVESVVFDYIATSGGAALNVNRRSDFTITLFDPSATSVGTVDITDAISGTTAVPQVPTLTATFAAPVSLSAPGTYLLQVKAGDFAGTDETGNHTGIDNLSINGTVTPIPEPATLLLFALGLLGLTSRRRPA